MKELLNVSDVAAVLGVRRMWVYAHAASGDLPHLRIGRFIRFRRADLDDWLQTREARPKQ
jgi:excisionase family DNA binding protein